MSGVGKRVGPKYAISMHNSLLDKLFLSGQQILTLFLIQFPL